MKLKMRIDIEHDSDTNEWSLTILPGNDTTREAWLGLFGEKDFAAVTKTEVLEGPPSSFHKVMARIWEHAGSFLGHDPDRIVHELKQTVGILTSVSKDMGADR